MAKVSIVISDNDDGSIDISVDLDPPIVNKEGRGPLDHKDTPAQTVGAELLYFLSTLGKAERVEHE